MHLNYVGPVFWFFFSILNSPEGAPPGDGGGGSAIIDGSMAGNILFTGKADFFCCSLGVIVHYV